MLWKSQRRKRFCEYSMISYLRAACSKCLSLSEVPVQNICFHSLHCFPNESCVACFYTVCWYLDLLGWSPLVCFVWSACSTKTISSRIGLEYFFSLSFRVVYLNHKLVMTRQRPSVFGLSFRTGPAILCEHWQKVPFLFPFFLFSHSFHTTHSLAFQLCVCV